MKITAPLLQPVPPRGGGKCADQITGPPPATQALAIESLTCSNRLMDVRRPDSWCYPLQCSHGHVWAPGLISVGWLRCALVYRAVR